MKRFQMVQWFYGNVEIIYLKESVCKLYFFYVGINSNLICQKLPSLHNKIKKIIRRTSRTYSSEIKQNNHRKIDHYPDFNKRRRIVHCRWMSPHFLDETMRFIYVVLHVSEIPTLANHWMYSVVVSGFHKDRVVGNKEAIERRVPNGSIEIISSKVDEM